MNYLLDTHLLLWAAAEPDKLSIKARETIEDRSNSLYFSPASLWEIAIKSALGRKDFYVDTKQLRIGLLQHDYREVSITGLHINYLVELPDLHKDPFDRLLLAQSRAEDVTLLTSDKVLANYPGNIILV